METTTTSQSIGFGGDASIKTVNTHRQRLIDESKGLKNEYEYLASEESSDIQLLKTVWKDGSPFALFEINFDSLPDHFVELVCAHYRESCGFEAPTDALGWAKACQDWARCADETVCLDSSLVWIRCSINSGNPYSLTVAPDAEVCESCDIVLGNWSMDGIVNSEINRLKHRLATERMNEDKDPEVIFEIKQVLSMWEDVKRTSIAPIPNCESIWKQWYNALSN